MYLNLNRVSDELQLHYSVCGQSCSSPSRHLMEPTSSAETQQPPNALQPTHTAHTIIHLQCLTANHNTCLSPAIISIHSIHFDSISLARSQAQKAGHCILRVRLRISKAHRHRDESPFSRPHTRLHGRK